MLKGFPGSGKSTIGRALSKQLVWPLIDKDDIKDKFGEQIPDADALAYDVMLSIVRRQLLQGLHVICDSPLTFSMTYERAQAIATETNARLLIVECFCSDERVWSQRVNVRKERSLPKHHMTDWERVLAYRRQHLAASTYPIMHPHLLVDTARPLDICITQIVEWLNNF